MITTVSAALLQIEYLASCVIECFHQRPDAILIAREATAKSGTGVRKADALAGTELDHRTTGTTPAKRVLSGHAPT